MSEAAKTSRTQQRADETRRAVLDAAVESLMALGFARTTTLEVQKRAGVSRGALLHHYPSKAELIGAAVRHLAEMRGRELKDATLPEGEDRVGAAIDLLWESFSGPLFYVSMELRNASRTDPELRSVLTDIERDLGDRILAQSRRLFGAEVSSQPGFEIALHMTLQLMIGSAMTCILHREEGKVEVLIREWKQLFPGLLSRGCKTESE